MSGSAPGAPWLRAPDEVLWCERRDPPPEGDAWLGPGEREVQDSFRFERRRVAWRLGRFTAKRLLASVLDVGPDELRRIQIIAASDGAPEAFLDREPLPWSLSISHRPPVAVAAVGLDPLGIDYETVEAREPSFVRSFFTDAEQEAIAAAGPDADRVCTVMWSAKEAVLKVRRTGLRRDTRSVQVSLRDGARGRERDDWRPLTVDDIQDPSPVHARWRPFARGVLVLAATAPCRIAEE